MIKKYYEIECDHCNMTELFAADNITDLNRLARIEGWILTTDKKHFCDNECLKSYREINKN